MAGAGVVRSDVPLVDRAASPSHERVHAGPTKALTARAAPTVEHSSTVDRIGRHWTPYPRPPVSTEQSNMEAKKLGSTLQAINAQIAALQAKADAIRKQEAGDVIAKIKDAIAHYGLTAQDLGFSAARPQTAKAPKGKKLIRKKGRKSPGAASSAKSARAAKYADGQGRTWAGIGNRPEWFKAALAAGKTPEDLLIKT